MYEMHILLRVPHSTDPEWEQHGPGTPKSMPASSDSAKAWSEAVKVARYLVSNDFVLDGAHKGMNHPEVPVIRQLLVKAENVVAVDVGGPRWPTAAEPCGT